MSTIERRAASGAFAGAVSFAMMLGQSLVQVPLLLSFWSVDTYGAWITVLATGALLFSFDAGHQGFLGNTFHRLWITKGPELRGTFASGIRVALLFAGIELTIGFLLAISGNLGRLAQGTRGGVTPEFAIAFLLYLVFWAVNGSPIGILNRIYPSAGDYTRSIWLGVGYRLIGFLALVGAVVSGAGLIGAMLAQIIGWGAFNLFVLFDAWRRYPELHYWWKDGSWSMGWNNFRASLFLSLANILEQIAGSGLVLLVARFLLPAQVALVSTLRTVTNTAVQGSSILLSPIVPDMVRYHVRGEGAKLSAAFAAAWLVGGTLTTMAFGASLWMIKPLYVLWTRGALIFDSALFASLALAVCVRLWAAPMQNYLSGINRLMPQLGMTSVKSVGTLVTAAILLPCIGAAGAGWGVLVGECLGAAVIVAAAKRELAAHYHEFPFRAAIESAGQIVLLGGALAIFAFDPPGFGFFLTGALLCISLLGIMQWRGLPGDVQFRLSALAAPFWKRVPR
jgi:O-antigen/teichoic acid export membrane protein